MVSLGPFPMSAVIVLVGLLYGAWRVRGRKPLRWPLAIGAVAGLMSCTLFFDAEGRLVDVHMGELTQASLARKLQRFGPR